MNKATVRPDLLAKWLIPPASEGSLPEELMDKVFDSIQPDELDDDEFNTIIRYRDRDNNVYSFLVNSIDFEFEGADFMRTEALGFSHDDVIGLYQDMLEDKNAILTEQQCAQILERLLDIADFSIGVSWDTLEQAISDTVEIRKKEQNQCPTCM